jgi:hypothetical protein
MSLNRKLLDAPMNGTTLSCYSVESEQGPIGLLVAVVRRRAKRAASGALDADDLRAVSERRAADSGGLRTRGRERVAR